MAVSTACKCTINWPRWMRQKATDGTAIAKALDYSLGRWEALTRFLDDGALPIDNNWIENRIRPIALGRSNWLFAGSLRAGKRAAAVMSLIQSAKLNGHDPYRYLKDVLERLPTQPASRIGELLPHSWTPAVIALTHRVRARCLARTLTIDDSEYLKVYQRALPSLQLAMTLAIRTLALPADVLKLGPRNVKRYDDGTRTLRWSRGKTNVKVEVAIVGELAAALEPFLTNPTLHPTFVRREDGLPYTVDGIGAVFRRACVGYTGRGKRYSPNGDAVPDLGLRDLRAKGATEMYRAGIDIRRIQKLLGHKSVSTTEIYLKRLLAEIVRPNEQPIIALASKPST